MTERRRQPPRQPRTDPGPLARQARLAALVIAVAMVAWMAAQWLGGQMGWQARYVFLFDFAAMAAFAWAMVVTWRVWRSGREQ